MNVEVEPDDASKRVRNTHVGIAEAVYQSRPPGGSGEGFVSNI